MKAIDIIMSYLKQIHMAMFILVIALALFALIVRDIHSKISGEVSDIVRQRICFFAQLVEDWHNRYDSIPETIDDVFRYSFGTNSADWPPFIDSWGNKYVYKRTRNGFIISSNGPDGVDNTTDDIITNVYMKISQEGASGK